MANHPQEWHRREFLKFMGVGATGLALSALPLGCGFKQKADSVGRGHIGGLTPLAPTRADSVHLIDGLSSEILISWKDSLRDEMLFGFNNDYTAFLPVLEAPDEAYLWVNHEYVDPYFVTTDPQRRMLRTREQVKLERRNVGGSLVHIRRSGGRWGVVPQSKKHRRVDNFTKIAFSNRTKIRGARVAEGTMGNCAGGVTPWGTVLTCEENYRDFVGEEVYVNGQRKIETGEFSWESVYSHLPPEHYGWVIEIDPRTDRMQKLLPLGRFAHECATVTLTKDGRPVVYSGDDKADEHFYKFIGNKPGRLDQGTLYVANLKSGRWLALDRESSPVLKKHFRSQLDLLLRTREAAKLLGATPMNRPEDVAVQDGTQAIFVSCTNNLDQGDEHGAIWRFDERDGDPAALNFQARVFLTGGPNSGFSSPDNLAFDPHGNLWMTTDVSDQRISKSEYNFLGNNSLFLIPMKGRHAGVAFHVASGPIESEFTGPTFTPDGQTLFLSVQHPGASSRQQKKFTSHWPQGAPHEPKPSVITIEGPFFNRLKQLTAV